MVGGGGEEEEVADVQGQDDWEEESGLLVDLQPPLCRSARPLPLKLQL